MSRRYCLQIRQEAEIRRNILRFPQVEYIFFDYPNAQYWWCLATFETVIFFEMTG
ncbi:hypothetical protein SIAM614_15932 [Stappia aggregata IAM 12614]|uniref:Uncharacterized protein n=1 Tax=Roseibium aggregatum (strain ATCC 25650 / DSM 13394 / JCM 20685 / NBRC 16684 / NCIMB 2208 / IAM 12614 / B1) TaxID=384765 RepID=A0NWD3_ROSAI|nr:hypothetical protein SIAM614_15932 [Stappia aggregata IAM 12614] [Roseibium aggregatum IAM 12614]